MVREHIHNSYFEVLIFCFIYIAFLGSTIVELLGYTGDIVSDV